MTEGLWQGRGEADEPGRDPLPLMFGERRLADRARAFWEARRGGRAMPGLADCADIAAQSFGDHAVVFDLSGPGRRPQVRSIGARLADIVDPLRSETTAGPLDEFVRRLPAIALRQAPTGFEVDFPCHDGEEGAQALFLRGILLPLADADGSMGHILGVVNWRWSAAEGAKGDVLAAMAVVADAPSPGSRQDPAASAWSIDGRVDAPLPVEAAQRLSAARTWAALSRTDLARSDHHRHAAIGAIHDAMAGTDDVEVAGALRSVLAGEAEDVLDLALRAILHARRIGLPAGRLAGVLGREEAGIPRFLDGAARMRDAAQACAPQPRFVLTRPAERVAAKAGPIAATA